MIGLELLNGSFYLPQSHKLAWYYQLYLPLFHHHFYPQAQLFACQPFDPQYDTGTHSFQKVLQNLLDEEYLLNQF